MKFYLNNIPQLTKEDFFAKDQEDFSAINNKLKAMGIEAYCVDRCFPIGEQPSFIIKQNGNITHELHL